MTDLAPYCGAVGTDINILATCIQQSSFFNDPFLMQGVFFIGAVLLLAVTRASKEIASVVLFSISVIFVTVNPNPVWVVVILIITVLTVFGYLRGVRDAT